MSKRADSPIPVYTLFGTLWRLAVGGALLFAASAAGAYFAVEHVVRRPEVQAPNLLSHPLAEAVEMASRGGFAVMVEKQEATTLLDEGRVLGQRPPPDMWVKEGATLRLTIATRP